MLTATPTPAEAVSVATAARLLDVHRATVYRLIATAGLPTVRIGSKTRVPLARLREWIDANTTGGAA